MLIRVEVAAKVQTARGAHFYWDGNVDFKYDCFVCRRTDRTVRIRHGDEEGRCVSARKPPELIPPGVHTFDEVSFIHPAPLRMSAFGWQMGRDQDHDLYTVRCQLIYWWAPFDDAKDEKPATRTTRHPWVRLDYGLGCRACYNAGHKEALHKPQKGSIQTNMIWPVTRNCPTCGLELLFVETGPTITLVE